MQRRWQYLSYAPVPAELNVAKCNLLSRNDERSFYLRGESFSSRGDVCPELFC